MKGIKNTANCTLTCPMIVYSCITITVMYRIIYHLTSMPIQEIYPSVFMDYHSSVWLVLFTDLFVVIDVYYLVASTVNKYRKVY